MAADELPGNELFGLFFPLFTCARGFRNVVGPGGVVRHNQRGDKETKTRRPLPISAHTYAGNSLQLGNPPPPHSPPPPSQTVFPTSSVFEKNALLVSFPVSPTLSTHFVKFYICFSSSSGGSLQSGIGIWNPISKKE
jgi:hypothetical protein